MSTFDVAALLREIDPVAPCGPNVEHDPVFMALEIELRGKEEVQYGKTFTAAVPPDWKQVRRDASALLERSRDLRLATYLLRASLALHGIPGLADGMELIEGLLEKHWESVHPRLDPAENLDPTERVNSLAILADPASLLRELKDATLLVLPGLGALTLRTIEVANGEAPPPPGQERMSTGSIESAIADLDKNAVAGAVEALARALTAAVNIELLLVRQVGSSHALNLDRLTRPLRRAHDFLVRQQPQGPAKEQAATQLAAVAGAGLPGPDQPARTVGNDAIASRDDVLRALDKLIQYYGRHEPSSPIPILLERAKRLVPMNFFELMENLAPDGIAQLTFIRGPDGAKQEPE